MYYLIMTDPNSSPSTTVVNYSPMQTGGGGWSATEANVVQTAQFPFTMQRLVINLPTGVPPGVGKSYTYTVRKNGADTAMTITISDNAVTGMSTTAVSFAPGDTYDIASTPTGTPTACLASWSVLCSSQGEAMNSQIMGMGINGTTSAASYRPIFGSLGSATESVVYFPVSTQGTISRLQINFAVAPGGATAWTAAVSVNGVDSAVTTTVSGANVVGNDTTHSVVVVPGDTISLHLTHPSGVPASTHFDFSFLFTPKTPGESIYGWTSTASPSTTVANYNTILGAPNYIWNAADTNLRLPIEQCLLTRFCLRVYSSTGAGASVGYDYRIRKNSVDVAGLTVNNATSGFGVSSNLIGTPVQFNTGDYINFGVTPQNTPTAPTGMAVGYTLKFPGSGWDIGFF